MSLSTSLADLLEYASCPICDGDQYEVKYPSSYPTHLSKEELLQVYRSSSDHQLMDALVKCKNCSLVYLNPRVRSEIALESYSSAEDPTFISQNEFRIRTFQRSWKKVMQLTRTSVPQGKILDIGCAGGAFLKAARDLGFEGIGVEPNRWLCEQGKKAYDLDLRSGTLTNHSFEPESFQFVTLWDVLEHLYDPLEILRQSARLLSKEGFLVVNYPDYQSLARRMLGRRWPFFLSVHLFYFTSDTVTRLLNRAGFEVVSLSPHWQTLETAYVLKRASAYFSILGTFEKMARDIGIGQFPLTYQMGQTLVVAKKRGRLEI